MNGPALSRRSVFVSATAMASLPVELLGSEPAEAHDQGYRRFSAAQTSWLDEPAFTPAAEGWVDVDGAKLWYQDSGGTGVPIVLLHASTGSAASWRYQQSSFSKAGYRVITYSRRGHYRSTVQEPNKPISGAADLLLLAQQLKLSPFHLVGTAVGGFTALDFALSHPERVRSLVMASSLGGIDDPEFTEVTKRLLTPEFMALPSDIKELGPSYRALNPRGTERWVELEKMAAQGKPPMAPKENVIDWKTLQRLRPPTLFLTGDADLYMPPALFTLLKPHVPSADYVVIAEAGHSTSWEQPDAFNAAVLSFVAQH
ncbi:MAG TPA: alpha/beta hydrolase [Geminicoccus sp.]|jgi:pimeloyl-ACP methyl ester carboxylesterase|uniref:alpha/beta fold hydrolase n=1 Tax=Geminicoccus sp. TaxID=2024832 RepID=UPI002E349730|nr:alpha/beta hydrolase [Geminicoccus sp.]HEX2525557.1 alpha/beta hydrolase [Geminicoccus sp.]